MWRALFILIGFFVFSSRLASAASSSELAWWVSLESPSEKPADIPSRSLISTSSVYDPFGEVNVGRGLVLNFAFNFSGPEGYYWSIGFFAITPTSPDFTMLSNGCAGVALVVPPGGGVVSCPFTVLFVPQSPGEKVANYVLAAGTPDGIFITSFQHYGYGREREPFELRVTVDGGQTELGSLVITKMKPSIWGCGKLAPRFPEKKVKIECIDPVIRLPVPDCSIRLNVALGPDHGGHEHDFDTRPLGDLFPNDTLSQSVRIPIHGYEFVYSSPEVSGDVDLDISGSGPNGESLTSKTVRFEVMEGDFIPLGNEGLVFDVASHRDGDRGTERMKSRLSVLTGLFTDYTRLLGGLVVTVPVLESEAGSLSRGGLFDYNYARGAKWKTPHCGHRDGETADISYSVFEEYPEPTRSLLVRSLQLALTRAEFRFDLEVSETSRHWHIHTK